MSNSSAVSDLQFIVGKDEKILWQGKPDILCSVLEAVFNPYLPIFIIFGIIIIATFGTTKQTGIGYLIGLILICAYIALLLIEFLKYRNTEYIVTDKAVYVSGGDIAYHCNRKPFSELSRVDIQRGIIDQWLGVGDIILSNSKTIALSDSKNAYNEQFIRLSNIKMYKQLHAYIKKLQEDIYNDIKYPNDLRTAGNHGYKTNNDSV